MKKEKEIPTAEDLLIKFSNEHSYNDWPELMYDTHDIIQIEYTREVMIEFAKLHVKRALEQAAFEYSASTNDVSANVIEGRIKSCYPESNIK